jgi:hypothetical protein
MVLILSFVAILAAGCGGSAESHGPPKLDAQSAGAAANEIAAADARGIQMMTVRAIAVPEYLDLPARIEADPTQSIATVLYSGFSSKIDMQPQPRHQHRPAILVVTWIVDVLQIE